MEENKEALTEKCTQPELKTFENRDWQARYKDLDVKNWERTGTLPKELFDHFFEQMKKQKQEHKKHKEFYETHPNPTEEEVNAYFGFPQTLSPEESEKSFNEMKMQCQFHDFLVKQWDTLTANIPEEIKHSLFNSVNNEMNFGMSRVLTDSIYYLSPLLRDAKLNNIHENLYEAKGSIQNSKNETISIVYNFNANSNEEACLTFNNYKNIMINKGLKIWMAYWKMANEMGRLEYSCSMIDIMKHLCDEDRKSFFSVKEKEEHWAITKMLSMTKLTREKQVKKRGSAGTLTRWVEQPLVEIVGGEKETESPDKYPTTIAVRVLAPTPKAYPAALYANSTLTLNPNDAYLAFMIQTRANQRGRGEKSLLFYWDFLFEAGNLQATAESKKAVAKAQTRKKMDRFKKDQIIEGWNEELLGVSVKPKSKKKKTSALSD